MSCRIHCVALAMLVLGAPLFAQSTPPPPDWHDSGASVYLETKRQPPPGDATTAPAAPPGIDDAVAPASHQEAAPDARAAGDRRLPPPTSARTLGSTSEVDSASNLLPGGRRGDRRPDFGLPINSIYTVLSALAIVIGAFLLFTWLLRRGGRAASKRLPDEVVSVLGRVPLAARHHAELLRVGNKLVLVSLTPAGAEPLAEVTDPVEVDRLLGLCQQHGPHSTTKAFEQIFHQLSSESPSGAFLGDEPLPPASAAHGYRAHTGGHRT